jgi:cytochrome oxidase assembly protein ShyY1
MIELREQLIFLLFIVILMLIAPLVLIALAFWSGIRKAKKREDFNRKERRSRTLGRLFFVVNP